MEKPYRIRREGMYLVTERSFGREGEEVPKETPWYASIRFSWTKNPEGGPIINLDRDNPDSLEFLDKYLGICAFFFGGGQYQRENSTHPRLPHQASQEVLDGGLGRRVSHHQVDDEDS